MRSIAPPPDPLAVLPAWRDEPGLASLLMPQLADPSAVQGLIGVSGALEPVPGGFSGSRVWKLVAPDERCWSLKCWPADGPDEARLLRIAGLLRRAADAGCSAWIACPSLTTDGRRPFARHADRLWQLQPWLPGVAENANGFSPEIFDSAVDRIVQLHHCWKPGPEFAAQPRAEVPPSIRQRLEGLAGVTDRVTAILRLGHVPGDARGGFGPLTSEQGIGESACRAAIKLAPRLMDQGSRLLHRDWIVQPVLTDLWRENLLFCRGQLSGIIDYGSLREDLLEAVWARLLGSLDLENTPGWEFAAAGGGARQVAWARIQSACAGRIEFNHESLDILGFLEAAGTVLGCLQWIDPLSVQNRVAATSPAARERAVELMKKTIALAARY